ncbi:putative holin-like toxin [Enterococcus cecorum]|nr:putative holin-like toxin [Enterococcus cecorum]
MSVYEALILMIGFGTFIVTFLDLVVRIIEHLNDKK